MKRTLLTRVCTMLLLSFTAIVMSAQTVTVNVTQVGGLWDELEAQGVTDFTTVKDLTVTGTIGESDLQLIKLQMSNLENLDISGTNVTEIHSKAFQQKDKLKTVRLPEGINYIRSEAFSYCQQLTSVTFGNQSSVTGRIVFPASLRFIDWQAFYSCSLLTHLDFSACTVLEGLGSNTFQDLFNLQEVLFPSQGNLRLEWACFGIYNQIWDEASQEWVYKGLETMTLTKAVTYINGNVFPRTLKTLYVESANPPECYDDPFSQIFENETVSLKVYVPKGSKRNYAIANGWGRLYQYMQEVGLQLSITGYGSVQQGNRTYTNGDVVFVNESSVTTLKAVPEVGCELLSVKINDTAVDVAADGTFTVPAGTTVGTLDLAFTANPMAVNNPNGGELSNNIAAMGSNPRTIRALKVTGKMTAKDWTYVKNVLTALEELDLSETDVTTIPEYTFDNNKTIKNVYLPSTVTTIEPYAFRSCDQLTTVDGCENVEELRDRAFQFCSKLANFPFGDKLRSIESGVFEGCTSLPESLVMPASLNANGWIDYLFNASSVRSFDLSQCTFNCEFAWHAFGQCTSLILPEKGNYRLREGALAEAQLTELRLPAGATMWGEKVLPATLKHLYVSSTTPCDVSDNTFEYIDFDNCTLYVPAGSSEAYEVAAYWSNFYKVEELGYKINISGFGVVQQGNVEYSNGDVYMPSQSGTATLKAVPEQGCQLLSVKISGDAVDVAADGSFTLPEGATTGTIDVAFSINQIVVDNSNGGELKEKINAMGISPDKVRALKVVGKMTTKDWNFVMSSLTEIGEFDISETNITRIPESALRDKENLTTVHLPSTVVTIERNAFHCCHQLTIVDGCENVTEIGYEAFNYCNKLSQFPFGNKIKSIDAYAFFDCQSLPETLVMPASLNSFGYGHVFSNSSIKSFDLSQCSLTNYIGDNTFGECTSLVLPENGEYYFSCNALQNAHITELRLPAAVTGLTCDNVLPTMLERLYVSRTEPLSWIDNNALRNLDLDNCTLFVPVGSVDAYSEANGWSLFSKIQEYGFKVKTGGLGVVVYEGKSYKEGETISTPQGTALTMQVVPSSGYEIEMLKVDGTAYDFADDGTFTVPATVSGGIIDVTFAKKQLQLDIAMEGDGSYTIEGQTYTAASTLPVSGGDVVKIQLQPTTGNFVKQVTINGEDAILKNGGLELTTVVLDDNVNIVITFSNDATSVATVTFQQDGLGTVSCGDIAFEDGATLTLVNGKSITLTFAPDGDSNFQSLLVNGTDVTTNVSDGSYTMNNVSANTTVKTTFFSPNIIAVNNPNGGELRQQILDQGSSSGTLRALKVVGTMTTKDWNFVMSGLPLLESFDISETDVKTIPESAFQGKEKLTTVHLPSTVVTIERYAFQYCCQLTTIDGCENVEELRDRSFSSCSKLSVFPFGDKLRVMESAVFESCSSLPESLVMPASLNTFGWDNMFNGSSVRNFDLSQCTFNDCSFSWNAFGEATSLKLPEKGNYQMYDGALRDAKLTELLLPAALSSLYGDDVLPTTLERLYVSRTTPVGIGSNNTFRNIDVDHCILYVPVGAVDAYSEANGWSLFAKVQEYGFKVKTGGLGVVKFEGKSYKNGETIFSPQGSALTMQVVPSSGYDIATLKVGGLALDYADDGTFTIPATISGGIIEVTFTQKQLQLDIAMEGDGSYTIEGQTYTAAATLPVNGGDVVKIHLQPATGGFVKQVIIDGEDAILKNGGLELTTAALDANTNIVIIFSSDVTSIATVSFQQDGFGKVNYGDVAFENGSTLTLVKGKSITLTFTPNGDSNFQSLLVNGTDVTTNVSAGSYTMSDVSANTTVKTTFFSPNMITVDNPDGGGLKDMITAMGSNPRTVRALKVVGKMISKDWSYVKNNMPALEEFDISLTDVKVIPDEALCDRENLTIVHLPATVITIANSAFRSCHQLTTVDGFDNVREIGSSTFAYCEKLSNFPFGDAIRVIESDAFYNCYSLPETLVMPASLNNLGWSSVFNGSSVLSFDLSQCTLNGTFAYNAFGKCTSLILPEKGDYVMAYQALKDAELTELRLPAALTGIYGEDVLPTTLERLYVSRSEPFGVDNNTFRNIDTDQCTLYIPIGATEAYANAEHWSDFTKVKEYGMQVTVGEQGKVRAGTQTLMGKTVFFPKGSTATFEIIPNAGWHADAVKLNGADVPFADNLFTLSGDQLSGTLAVEFAVNKFNLDLQIAGDGKVKLGSLEYTAASQTLVVDSLATLNFTLEPAEGNVVSAISFNGKESVVQNGGTTYVTPAITANATLAITFGTAGAGGDFATYTVSTGEGGTVEYKNTTLLPETTIQLPKGQEAVFTIKPEQYFVVDAVKLNGQTVTSEVDADGNLTVKDVNANATLEVTFRVMAEIAVVMEDGGNLTNMLSDKQKQNVTKLTIKGRMYEQDFYTMRDEMPQLATVDLWEAEIEYVPYCAFCTNADWSGSVGHKALTSIRLPESIRWISDWAFAGCSSLKEVNFTELKNLESISSRAFGWTALNVIDLTQTKITSVGSEFYRVKNLENIKLPLTLTWLGDAFCESSLTEIDLSGCTNLKTLDNTFSNSKNLVKVTLPEGLTSISNSTFNGCDKLTTINFPKSLQNIASWAFAYTKLQKADLSGLTELQSIGEYAFYNCTELTEVLFPASLQLLNNRAFSYCNKLTSIDLSKTQLTAIAEGTFEGCYALESFKLPKTLETIGRYAFAWNGKLGGVLELGPDFKSIGECAFEGTQISVIRSEAIVPPVLNGNSMPDAWVAAFVPEGYAETYKAAAVWEDKVILDKEVHAEVTVSNEGNLAIDINQQAGVSPATITHLKVHGPLGPQDFAIMRSNMTLLYDLDLSDAEVSVIPENALLDKKVLMNVKLPASLLRIEHDAFRGCSSLEGTLTLPNGLKFIGWAAFQGCSSLEEVVLNNNLEVIQGYAFEGCSSLAQEITLPRDFQSLGERAFANCSSLYGTVKFNRDFYMFMGNEGYGSSAGACFENCSKIETVDLSEPDFLEEIPYRTFAGCKSLTTVLLPPYLERIDNEAFIDCSSLDNLEFPSTLLVINWAAFQSCTSLRSINLSDCKDFGTIEGYAFNNCSSLETVYLPKSLNWIREYAFADCRKLANLTVEALHPADLGEYVFRHVHTDRCVLSIPTGTFYDYLSAAQWGEFVSMRKSIDVTVGEGANLFFISDDLESSANYVRRRVQGTTQNGSKVKDGSSLYVQENEKAIFQVNPDENVQIAKVLFNGEDVTDQLVNGTYQTPGVTDASSFEVQVNVVGDIHVKELRLLDSEVAVKKGENRQLRFAVYPTNATNKEINWTSSDENIATINSNGIITGVAPGRAEITGKTVDGEITQTCEVVIMSNDYWIVMDNTVDNFVENNITLPLALHNDGEARDIQFDVYLPDGMDMPDWNGNFGIQTTDRTNGHTVAAARMSDGGIRVMVYSLDGNAFQSNDGDLLWLPFNTGTEVGEFDVTIKNIHISGPDNFDFVAPNHTIHFSLKDYPLGDSNGSGDVTITDVANTVDNILGRNYGERFVQRAADANKDGQITIADVTETVDIILGRSNRAAYNKKGMHRVAPQTTDKLFINDFSVAPGEQMTVELKLDNTVGYTAFQCDLLLPEGFDIAKDEAGRMQLSLTGRKTSSHVLSAERMSDGALRIVAYSIQNEAFNDSEEGIVSLTLQVDETAPQGLNDVLLRDVRLVKYSDRTEYVAPDTHSQVDITEPTGINNLMAVGEFQVTVEGRELVVLSPKSTTTQLITVDGKVQQLRLHEGRNRIFIETPGVYIICGKKLLIK